MHYLLRHAAAHRGLLAAGLVLALLGSAAGLAQPLAAQSVIDSLGGGGSLLVPVVLLSLLVLGSAVANGVNSYLLDRTGEHVVLSIRRRLAARLVRIRVPELDTRAPGDLVTRATSDTGLVRHATTSAPVTLVNGAVGMVGALVLMAVLDLRLFGVTVAVLVVVGAPAALVLPRIRRATEQAQSAVGTVGSVLDRVLGAARTVKAYGAERREQAAVDDAATAAFRAGVVQARWEALLVAGAEFALQASFLVVLAVGGGLVATGALTVSTLVAFLLYLFYLATPLTELVSAVGTLQQGLGAARRLAEVEDIPVEDDVDPGAFPVPPRTGPPSLVFDDVRFAHPGRAEVLRGVRFAVPAGSRVALVGPSGAGKSTLLSLLLRFHPPTGGTVTVDGVDLAAVPRATWRSRVGVVEQDSPVLDGTLRENLLLGAPDATAPALAEVVWATRLTELVERLPRGLDTPLGARGVTLSGGERQRVAIARALLRRPGLLLLDEATAHLDSGTEEALHELLSGRRTGATVLVVAHRLRTVRDAEAVVVLDGGRVRAVGTHEELLASDELYRSLAAAQAVGAGA
ncbi:ABC transporter ATP-binding protein [Pseudonocardia sp. ICBG162]|uniref:ABC transporter ATP-binding protein n=1 Tax=Pseudonocardia sp. ICBG162 TaxID=2846761 RepID=UPI001CF6C0E0|nr:ABC transporter ATP-binding protein [Pseudonocardia sp. ICBG162]